MLRIWSVFSLMGLLYLGVIVRLFQLQVLSGDTWKIQAENQHYIKLPLAASRGKILDINENVIVSNQPAYLVYAQPKLIDDLSGFSLSVSDILSLDEKELSRNISQPDKVWFALSHKTDQSKVDELKNLNLQGLGFENEPIRFYPESSMAAHLLGFVGSDINGQERGYFGLEGYYNQDLKGKDGSLYQEKDVHGNPIIIGQISRVDPQDGRTLVLWLDRAVQRIAETRLAEAIKKYGASEGTVTVYDPKSGGILAMATYPYYDPQKFSEYPQQLYKNPIISHSYEPGSTFKALVMAAAVDQDLVRPDTRMNEDGPVKIGQYYIRTWNDKYHGMLDMTHVLVNSSNVGMVFVARKLGVSKMLKYIDKYGFGSITGIDLEEESSPEIRTEDNWQEIDLATASFGQGIAVTPIQMVRAISVIANQGWLMKPQVVRVIKDDFGKNHQIKPVKVRQVISAKTAGILTEMMIAAVDEGEAKWAKPQGYRIAGKTGTAQIPVAGHYDTKKTIASFVGFAPADDPKFTILVTLREPSSSPWGSETAAPLFFRIAEDLFSYFGIPSR